MTKTEVLSQLAANTQLDKKSVSAVLDGLLDLAKQELSKPDGEFLIPGLLKLKTVAKPATKDRPGVNPFTKQAITIKGKPASKKLKATPEDAPRQHPVARPSSLGSTLQGTEGFRTGLRVRGPELGVLHRDRTDVLLVEHVERVLIRGTARGNEGIDDLEGLLEGRRESPCGLTALHARRVQLPVMSIVRNGDASARVGEDEVSHAVLGAGPSPINA